VKIVVFGLSISSSWGNGHATLWRGLVEALHRRNCHMTFFERDTPYYAGARDMSEMHSADLVIYPDWDAVLSRSKREVADADAVIITSFCPDALAAKRLIEGQRCIKVFYDLDTPVTLDAVARGQHVPYIPPDGLASFDLVLSYTGGAALGALQAQLGARHVAPLYGHVDPQQYRPVAPARRYVSGLSYLGTYAADRQEALDRLFLEPARARPELRFTIAGAQYPPGFPWLPNLFFVRHLPPDEHPAFYASSRLTLNVTRRAMARSGWCPSGRLFEAASCGGAIMSDVWEGIETFYEPGSEILLVRDKADVLGALELTDQEIGRIGDAARARTLTSHTSDHRAEELLRLLSSAPTRSQAAAMETT
jgi:spore maturation protein CgeB